MAVTLSVEPERQVVIPIVATDSDTATLRALRALKNSVYASPQDYSLVAASVTFEKGETQKTITFTATPDTLDDDGEVVDLAIGTLPPGVKLGTNYSSTVRIDDDDHPVLTVAFESSTYAVDEGNDVSIKVTLSAVPERAVSIQISKTNDEASNADYSGVPAKLDFGAAETREDHHLHRDRRQPGRGQREGQAGLRLQPSGPDHRGDQRRDRRDDQGQRHRRRQGIAHGPDGDRGRHRHLHGEAQHQAFRQRHHHPDQPIEHRHNRAARHPDLHSHHLGHNPDGDGKRSPGRRRTGRYRHRDPCRHLDGHGLQRHRHRRRGRDCHRRRTRHSPSPSRARPTRWRKGPTAPSR